MLCISFWVLYPPVCQDYIRLCALHCSPYLFIHQIYFGKNTFYAAYLRQIVEWHTVQIKIKNASHSSGFLVGLPLDIAIFILERGTEQERCLKKCKRRENCVYCVGWLWVDVFEDRVWAGRGQAGEWSWGTKKWRSDKRSSTKSYWNMKIWLK